MSDDPAKHYDIENLEANLYVLQDDAKGWRYVSHWKKLAKQSASYPYLEIIRKKFLASAGLHSRKQEVIFSRETIRRLEICLNTNEAFLGNNRLKQIYFDRNGVPVADSPISRDENKRHCLNTISDFA